MVRNVDKRKVRHLDGYTVIHWFPKLKGGGGAGGARYEYISLKILSSIYFATFDSYLSYYCLVWAQNFSTIQQIVILLKKAVRIINFQPGSSHTSPLFNQISILKFQD